MVLFLLLSFLLNTTCLKAQVFPPCGLDYGSAQDEVNLSKQMRLGDSIQLSEALRRAKNTRGTNLGCSQSTYPQKTADITQPSLNEILENWETVHVPALLEYTQKCPRLARYENNSALGAYFAMQAGYFNQGSKLVAIAEMMYAQQYAKWNVEQPLPRNTGVFGYVYTKENDNCYLGGNLGPYVSQVCNTLPAACVIYTDGLFKGKQFLVSAQNDSAGWFDGGLAYDQGWAGVFMIESSIMQTDNLLKTKYKQAALLAGQYALSEYSVKNHNYTAKLIWLLAQLYAWTGDSLYKSGLNLKLNQNLLPGILWDANQDGFVDGTEPKIAFSSLLSLAQKPGRMWDGHNALAWYQAINAWALVEAYVAFRDRNDTQRAAELKPYALTMLNNLAEEILVQGVPAVTLPGIRDMAYALLLGLWKISAYEKLPQDSWEKAVWALWNTGQIKVSGTNSVCMGMYLLVLSKTPYIPLSKREQVQELYQYPINKIKQGIPLKGQSLWEVFSFNKALMSRGTQILLTQLSGKSVFQFKGQTDFKIGSSGIDQAQLQTLPKGVYIVSLWRHGVLLGKKSIMHGN